MRGCRATPYAASSSRSGSGRRIRSRWWDYRFGYGYFSAIVPKEMAGVDAKNWKNMVGTGPFQLTEFVQGNSQTYVRNAGYWDTEKVNGTAQKLPFVDKVVYRTIKDEATQRAALRTGKLDMSGTFLAMRVDQKPFTDIRVRRALNMAVNKPEIVSAYEGKRQQMLREMTIEILDKAPYVWLPTPYV